MKEFGLNYPKREGAVVDWETGEELEGAELERYHLLESERRRRERTIWFRLKRLYREIAEAFRDF